VKITVKNSDVSPPEEIDVIGVHPPKGMPACEGCGFSHGGVTAELQCLREALRVERARIVRSVGR
jgi:hypothetical protein